MPLTFPINSDNFIKKAHGPFAAQPSDTDRLGRAKLPDTYMK